MQWTGRTQVELVQARDPAAILVLGGLALGGALALATPTRMRQAPEPEWRKGTALAQQQADLAPAPFSAETYPVDAYPVPAQRLSSPLSHAVVFVGDAVRAGKTMADDIAAFDDGRAVSEPPAPPADAEEPEGPPQPDADADGPDEPMTDDPAQPGYAEPG
ncbi:MAG: hypothetical protein RIS94_2665 [Pseudomonadota bacterium]|jgi:hypothetical protein